MNEQQTAQGTGTPGPWWAIIIVLGVILFFYNVDIPKK